MYELIMIIDDSKEELLITKQIVTNSNCAKEILEFASAVEALLYLRDDLNKNRIPQLIFVDIHMPLMNGFQFLKAFNQLPAGITSNCQVYVVSSTADTEDIMRINRDKTAMGFFPKPLTRAGLQAIRLKAFA